MSSFASRAGEKRMLELDRAAEAFLGAAVPSGSSFLRGWCLDQSGFSRYGWCVEFPGGRVVYLGLSVKEVWAKAKVACE